MSLPSWEALTSSLKKKKGKEMIKSHTAANPFFSQRNVINTGHRWDLSNMVGKALLQLHGKRTPGSQALFHVILITQLKADQPRVFKAALFCI